MGLLLNPATNDYSEFDAETRRLLRATIDFFESYGKQRLLEADLNAEWVADFLEFEKKEKLFATFLTPAAYAAGDEDRRWDAARNAALSEILGFYGLAYWYAEQVTILGLGPIWMSSNEVAKTKAAQQLLDGEVMAFGLSERAHGADVYSTDMVLTSDDAGGFTASGTKYYIGNGNVAGMVSVFGRRADVEGPDGYVFFAVDSRHENYHLIDNVVHGQMFVSTFELDDYPVGPDDILHTGPEAFAAALNTVNVGKFNLCHGSVGMCTHSLYEAITHTNNRILYGNRVTDFSHVQGNFVDAFARLSAMKLFSNRAVDYFRSASLDDRRYLLFNPVTKSKVTSEGETVMTLLLDAVAAKGYEKNTYFHQANRFIGWLPRLEGTVHVNVGQILKFMPNYLFGPVEYPEIGTRLDASDDTFFFAQGPVGGAGKVRFADWTTPYAARTDVANVAVFYEQAQALQALLQTAAPSAEQQKDLDFVLTVGHLFSLVVYGQLILEQAAITGLDDDLLNRIFDFQIRDFSGYAVSLYGKPTAKPEQQAWALGAVRRPVADAESFDRVWQQVKELDGAYEMPA
ncbi:acyl-CoA dehydrogenase family protein [Gordonia otitidis]|uniref:Acyl-CoA dehydrogenase n=1 Tax=Gordonia otitidis (strain DSM 44809 / CCUG 52243 / JCM 12355 / NBRC 100426 / IFM 10032) TaxID=1108044 RepID=H5THC4_GORO1|nr:acyl-CoA dehydrogenase family protein [Gordonia otitidis]GAB32882.1 putative acyl-CoA dehydrogenase [Gordonia otitidis NBRC 100426]